MTLKSSNAQVEEEIACFSEFHTSSRIEDTDLAERRRLPARYRGALRRCPGPGEHLAVRIERSCAGYDERCVVSCLGRAAGTRGRPQPVCFASHDAHVLTFVSYGNSQAELKDDEETPLVVFSASRLLSRAHNIIIKIARVNNMRI